MRVLPLRQDQAGEAAHVAAARKQPASAKLPDTMTACSAPIPSQPHLPWSWISRVLRKTTARATGINALFKDR